MAAKKLEPATTVIRDNTFRIEPMLHNAESLAAIEAVAMALEANARALDKLASSINGARAVGVSIGAQQ